MKVINRTTGELFQEKIFGEKAVLWLHGNSFFQRLARNVICKTPLFSWCYGAFQKCSFTKKKIELFIKQYDVDSSEFADEEFSSFNDFFIRKLKSESRPIAEGVIIPADARYLFFDNVDDAASFWIKGAHWSLEKLLGSKELASKFEGGVAVLARLAPPDYHRFHFPVSGVASRPRLIKGALFSVNPISLRLNPHVFSENKRMVTEIETEEFGTVVQCEIGAVNVGSIHQTAKMPGKVVKGEEKGYFSFGASAVLLLFEKGKINLELDLKPGREIYCKMGQTLGRS